MALTTFDHLPSKQAFTAPVTGPYRLTLWGAGGGSGRYSTGTTGASSGAGGAVSFVLNLNAGDLLEFEVGQGGRPGLAAVPAGGLGGWPDGGWASYGDTRPGGGGGSTRAYLNGILVGVAGAGGGSGGYVEHAGAGGGEIGQSAPGNGGTGGTQTAGGYDSNAPSVAAKKGDYLKGGNGGNVPDHTTSTSDDGGGGGGGYYGGGGGGGDGQSGGGGSAWADATKAYSIQYSRGDIAVPGGMYWTDEYKAGVAVGRARASDLPGGDGYAVVDDDPQPRPITVSKQTGFAVMQNPSFAVSKRTAAVVLEVKNLDVSEMTLYAVMKEGDPDPYNNVVRVSKAVTYAVMEPGTAGPLTYATSVASDILFTYSGGLRVTGRFVEAAQSRLAPAFITGRNTEALINAAAGSRISYLAAEVLRSTAEITVQALTTAIAADVALSTEGSVRFTTLYAEALVAAGLDGEDFGTVAVIN